MNSLNTIDETVLKLLRCPITKSGLTPANEELLNQTNNLIGAGEIQDNRGKPVQRQLDAALVNHEQSVLIPIRDGVISLTKDNLIVLKK